MLDLHLHLPMYLRVPGWLGALHQAVIERAGRESGNYAPSGEPRVTLPALRRSGVEVALSVLHIPFDELAPAPRDLMRLPRALPAFGSILRHGTAPNPGAAMSVALGGAVADRPPNPGAFRRVLRQLDAVERHVAAAGSGATVARSPAGLDRARDRGEVAVVHALEGAFHLPADRAGIVDAMAELARRGVAYLTVAHLFPRAIATVAPAIPYLSDDEYRRLFPQPRTGLSQRGHAIVEAAVREGILLDLSHMSEAALADTFALLDRLDPGREVPVIASHVGYRLGRQEYNLPDWAIGEIAARDGVVGVIAATHQLADGLPVPASLEESLELLFRHLDAIAAAAGGHAHTAIGTDLGGFIRPLPGLDDVSALAAVRTGLERRYGARDAARIAAANAERALRAGWGRR